MSPEQGEVTIAEIMDVCDQLADGVERYLEQLEAEHESAVAGGDPRHFGRVERGIGWSKELLDVIDDAFERLGQLRHNEHQLTWARQGKIV